MEWVPTVYGCGAALCALAVYAANRDVADYFDHRELVETAALLVIWPATLLVAVVLLLTSREDG